LDRDGVLSEEPTTGGWLPPRAPGGQPPPQFESAPPEPEPEPEAAPPAAERPIVFQQPTQPGNGAATTSVVLGIVGILLLLVSLGAGFLSVPVSVGAWIAGVQGRNRVARGETMSGDGLARAGVVLGIVGVVIGVIGTVVWIVLFASGFDFEEFRRDLEQLQRDLEEPSR
jgi:hypothetical protein